MADRTLQCPRDQTPLDMGKEHDIEVDHCPACKGAWYDDEELALLESTVADDPDHRRGMIDYAKRESELDCPVCSKRMRAFNYRAYNLELDACVEAHGFWLDAGESARIREAMQDRVAGLRRAQTSQAGWEKAKGRGRSGGVVEQLKGLFRGGARR